MKISKLFHWLYAIVMLLPVFFIGARCLYTICNKNAKDSYSQYSYTNFNEVNNVNDVIDEQTYSVIYKSQNDTANSLYYGFYNISIDYTTAQDYNSNYTYNSFNTRIDGRIYIYNSDRTSFCYLDGWGTTIFEITFRSNGFKVNDYNFNKGNSKIYLLNYKYGTLDNAFEYSVNQLNEVPIFSWAKDSFIVEPFAYITNLFGLEQSSPINTMLSYWASISIIWLCFDVLMYFPLLVHRWLDKGVLE